MKLEEIIQIKKAILEKERDSLILLANNCRDLDLLETLGREAAKVNNKLSIINSLSNEQ